VLAREGPVDDRLVVVDGPLDVVRPPGHGARRCSRPTRWRSCP
jgi:hypothetical protein